MRRLVLGLVAATALAGASAANATLYTATTTGCFGPACAPAAGPQVYGGLTFGPGSFSQSDSNGFLGIGSVAENFGTFTLAGTSFNYNSPPTLFTLLVTFTAPAGTVGANTFSSTITGSVTAGAGGIFVDFDNTNHLFTSSAGPFNVRINDLNVNADGVAAQITGQINAVNAVPEPAAWGMMLLGFAGIGLALRRRRRPALAQLA